MEPSSTPAEAGAETEEQFTTMSGKPIKAKYGPDEVRGEHADKIGEPGQYPFTRGPYELSLIHI